MNLRLNTVVALTEREEMVIVALADGANMSAIARQYHVTPMRIRQIRDKARRKAIAARTLALKGYPMEIVFPTYGERLML